MVLGNEISVMTEYMISYTKVCYLVNRPGIHFLCFIEQTPDCYLTQLCIFIQPAYVSSIK